MVASVHSRRPLHVRVERPHSELPNIALRAVAFATALLVLTVVTRRLDLIGYEELPLPLIVTGCVTAFALVVSLLALADSFMRGSLGTRKALRGFFGAALLCVPLGVGLALYFGNPRVNDVSTDPLDPPPVMDGLDTVVSASGELATRRYEATIERVNVGVQAALQELGWRIGGAAAPVPPAVQGESEGTAAEGEVVAVPMPGMRPLTQRQAAIVEAARLRELQDMGTEEVDNSTTLLRSTVTSPVVGLVSDIVIRLRDDGTFTTVDIRSRSREGSHDLGENVRRMRAFLTELDAAMIREGVR